MTLVGRATLYGTACGGQAGAARAIKILADEMERTFGYVGARSVSEIGPHIFAHHDPGAEPVRAPLGTPRRLRETA
jgi:(S)-mandelate dehydrogenase